MNKDVYISPATQGYRFDESIISGSMQFYNDVMQGLTQYPKKLLSKYFYDVNGDRIFQEIMHCPDYYPTRCELEIFTNRVEELAQLAIQDGSPFDLVELGAGDCYKSMHLLKELTGLNVDFNYIPIDISAAVLHQLGSKLPAEFPGLNIEYLHGEYFQMLAVANNYSCNRKVILCLGGNIGNMYIPEAHSFCKTLREQLSPGDLLITGFDLLKNPRIIRTAYDDRAGITGRFNLNLLHRINRELGADFNVNEFEHYCSYEPETGACKSFLVCLADTVVWIGDTKLLFEKNEYIWMEISQKYSLEQIDEMARVNGFKPVINLMDKRKWFVDACWQVI